MYEFRTTAGSFIGTEEHQILEKGNKIEVKNSKKIDSLPGYINKEDIDYSLVMDGLVVGDGSVHTNSNNLVFFMYWGK